MKIKADRKLLKLSPKRFILDKLIPFVMRDAGRGFAMDTWRGSPNNTTFADGIDRQAPACGTVACVGGSIQCLTGLRENQISKMAKLLGLSTEQTAGLFYEWGIGYARFGGWPEEYAVKYKKANTPYKKARVACALLRQIAKKGRAALPDRDDE